MMARDTWYKYTERIQKQQCGAAKAEATKRDVAYWICLVGNKQAAHVTEAMNEPLTTNSDRGKRDVRC